MDEPYHKTTIDQDRGEHAASGLRVMQLHDVIDRFFDYCHDSTWEDLGPDDRRWWSEAIAAIHSARVELESLPSEWRGRAREELDRAATEDLEQFPDAIRAAIAATEANRMDESARISLGDFANDFPEGQAPIGFYASIGKPAGEEFVLNDPDYTTPFDGELFDLNGTVDQDGIWRWDGEGNPTDFNRNTVTHLSAWYDHAEKAETIRSED